MTTGARVGVITDSTADLPLELAEGAGLRVVPMSVTFGSETLISRVSISDEEFYQRLAATASLPTTSQPNPHWFIEAWQDAADDGCTAVVSLHVSRHLSGTVSQAQRLAADAPLPVTVVDSLQVAGGLALMALAAQRTADQGADVDEVVAAAGRVGDAVSNRMVVDTMDYLRRGGRVTGVRAVVGKALRVRPILGVTEGRIESIGKARTMLRAIERIGDELHERHGDQPLALVITHALAPEAAAAALDQLGHQLEVARSLTTVFGPVLGTHTGPGAVSIAAVPDHLLPADPPDPRDMV